MRYLFSILLLTILALSSVYAGDMARVAVVYEYISNDPNESPEQAERSALKRAKIKALEDKFGLDVAGINSILTKNHAEGQSAESSVDVLSLAETFVRGEWIETTKENVLSKTYENGFWRVTVEVAGKVRCRSVAPIDIRYAFINSTFDTDNRDQYHDGDNLFLRFSSPVKGSLCVYLVDEDANAFCLLPYLSSAVGCMPIEANRDYLLFSETTDQLADEYSLTCQRSVEQNAIYIIFTPNPLTKASDRRGGKNWRNEPMPRQLSYRELITWLAKNRTRDAEMMVQTEIITIRK